MDRELTQMVLMTASRTMIELGGLPPIVNRHGEPDRDEPIKLAIGSAIYEIGLLMDRVFEMYPDLKQEYEARGNKYGRPYY
jgi:hypothetical protein